MASHSIRVPEASTLPSEANDMLTVGLSWNGATGKVSESAVQTLTKPRLESSNCKI